MSAAPLHAQQRRIDSVVMLDMSREMSASGTLEAARNLLIDLVPRVVRPGAQVAFVPFGDGVHEPVVIRVPYGAEGVAAARARLRRLISDARPREGHRYLYEAMERGLEQLRAFMRNHPERERRLVIVSTGARKVRRAEDDMSLAERIARLSGDDLAVGRDWSLWYGHFKGGDPGLRRFISQKRAGAMVPLDGGRKRRWSEVSIGTPYVDLGANLRGPWKRRVRITSKCAAGTVLAVRAGAGPGAGGATLTATPAIVRLRRPNASIEVELSGNGRSGGSYANAWLRLDGAGLSPVWVTGAQITVLTGASRAQASFASDTLNIGRVDRGTKITHTLEMMSNEDAKTRRATVRFRVADVPPDVDLRVVPSSLRLDEDSQVQIELTAHGAAKPGRYESRVVLSGGRGLRIPRRELAVRYRVGHGGIRILQARLVSPPLSRGGEVVARLTLVPDEGAVDAGATVRVEVGELPDGLDPEVISRFALQEETELEVRLRAQPYLAEGLYQTELRFSASGEIRVVPSVIPVEIEVVAPPPLNLGGTLDIGEYYQTRAERLIVEIPVDIDPAHNGTRIDFVAPSTQIAVEPSHVRLRSGRQTIRLSIRPPAITPGRASAVIDVYSIRDGERHAEGEYTVSWRVKESFLRAVEWRAPPPLMSGSNLVTGNLVIESSPDLNGKLVRVRAGLGDLPTGTHIAPGTDAIVLTGGLQRVTMPFDIVRAEPGRYEGRLDLRVDNDIVRTTNLAALKYEIVVEAPPVARELLDPNKRNSLFKLGGVLLGVVFVLALVFRRMRRRVRTRVEFPAPRTIEQLELTENQRLEVRSSLDEEKLF
ncbi:MAG: hypothetical protein ACYTGZ_15420 [Planctomycetota bacterium]